MAYNSETYFVMSIYVSKHHNYNKSEARFKAPLCFSAHPASRSAHTGNREDLKVRVHHDDPSERQHSQPMQTGQATLGRRFGAHDLAAIGYRAEGQQAAQQNACNIERKQSVSRIYIYIYTRALPWGSTLFYFPRKRQYKREKGHVYQ